MRRLVFRLVSMTSAAFALCLGLTLGAGPAGAAEFGPDDFGYTGADDAEESVTYEWVDFATATEAGELTPLPDDAQLDPLPIGFDFVFYGQTYAEVHPTTNGAFAFRRLIDYQFFAGEQCPLPTDGDVNGIVAFFLRDFNPDDPACDDSCHVRWARGGEEGSRWFGVEYENVPVYREAATDPAAAVTVQALLYEGTNEVRIQIADAGPALGGDATVGIEAPDAIAGLNVPGCLLEGSLRNEMAVVFRPPTGGTPVVPPHRTAWEQPGEAVDYTFTVFNLEAAEASFDLAVTGNTWDTALSDTTIAVLPGDFAAFTATVTIPAEAAGGSSDGATITLTPTGGGDALRSTVLTLVQDFPDDWQLLPEMPLVVDSPAVAVDGTDVFLIGGIVWDELALQKLVTDYVRKLDTETMGGTVGTQMYVFGGVEADSPFQPTEYTQYGLVERYPTSNLPDPPPAEVCNDDVDNDLDGATDCDDADCDAHAACQPAVEICNDGVDNDNDGCAPAASRRPASARVRHDTEFCRDLSAGRCVVDGSGSLSARSAGGVVCAARSLCPSSPSRCSSPPPPLPAARCHARRCPGLCRPGSIGPCAATNRRGVRSSTGASSTDARGRHAWSWPSTNGADGSASRGGSTHTAGFRCREMHAGGRRT